MQFAVNKLQFTVFFAFENIFCYNYDTLHCRHSLGGVSTILDTLWEVSTYKQEINPIHYIFETYKEGYHESLSKHFEKDKYHMCDLTCNAVLLKCCASQMLSVLQMEDQKVKDVSRWAKR